MRETATSLAQSTNWQRHSPIRTDSGSSGPPDPDVPGFWISVRRPLSIVSVFVRRGQSTHLAEAVESNYHIRLPPTGRSVAGLGVTFSWCGAGQFYAVGEEDLYRRLRRQFEGSASVYDQSDGRVMFRLQGSAVRDVLAKGCPVDLHPKIFGLGFCAVTQVAHVSAHLRRVEGDLFDLSVARSYAEYLYHWLRSASQAPIPRNPI